MFLPSGVPDVQRKRDLETFFKTLHMTLSSARAVAPPAADKKDASAETAAQDSKTDVLMEVTPATQKWTAHSPTTTRIVHSTRPATDRVERAVVSDHGRNITFYLAPNVVGDEREDVKSLLVRWASRMLKTIRIV